VPLRLSDLLERIRPAGAPGASSEGESRRADAELEELGAVARALARLDAEADAVIEAARTEAAEVRAAGDERARRALAELPDRVAAAEAAPGSDPGDAELAGTVAGTERDLAQRRAAADAVFDDLVDRAVAAIWELEVEP
jgi:hypothetical protein